MTVKGSFCPALTHRRTADAGKKTGISNLNKRSFGKIKFEDENKMRLLAKASMKEDLCIFMTQCR